MAMTATLLLTGESSGMQCVYDGCNERQNSSETELSTLITGKEREREREGGRGREDDRFVQGKT